MHGLATWCYCSHTALGVTAAAAATATATMHSCTWALLLLNLGELGEHGAWTWTLGNLGFGLVEPNVTWIKCNMEECCKLQNNRTNPSCCCNLQNWGLIQKLLELVGLGATAHTAALGVTATAAAHCCLHRTGAATAATAAMLYCCSWTLESMENLRIGLLLKQLLQQQRWFWRNLSSIMAAIYYPRKSDVCPEDGSP